MSHGLDSVETASARVPVADTLADRIIRVGDAAPAQRRNERHGAAAEKNRVAVRRRLGERLDADTSIRTRPVVDDDVLAERFR